MNITFKGVLGVVALTAVVIYFTPNTAPNRSLPANPVQPELSQSALLKGSEIVCDRPFWKGDRKDSPVNRGATGFFIKISNSKAELYAEDEPHSNRGNLRFSGDVKKIGNTFSFSNGSQNVDFQISENNQAVVSWSPDSTYHIAQSGCKVSIK